ncbi:NAD(P)(+) transhydrogenase (Re/Si-specific) subunit beta [Alteromonas sp. ASW11-36]|uniref:NAD(P) transhydrogenase subunit beta n=1 Tax=Alteromonas arenosi TaxID=3055817 RepID=A0ABT7SWH9_9ALTE|nr:NAD(P)(+) transhydrogenase (Re/Si-specific) subunit beta [Alteromonas sp. ASW11-36]MDM7860521.1 NAD(P)(+) transhydrogenase (Re/Si-specific) subunit beta [Alteromonas sp. ASW11-36]
MSSALMVNASYLVAATCFIFGLKLLSHPSSARKGNLVSAVGMLIAVLVTLIDKQILSYEWIAAGVIFGSIPGVWLAKRVEMTAMPELVSIFNGFGGLASLLLGVSSLTHSTGTITPVLSVLAYLAVIIGGVTFTGSIIAWLKLGEHMPTRAIIFPLQRWLYGVIILAVVVLALFAAMNPGYLPYFYVAIGLALLFGILATLPIGGADMPVVISLLNSYSGVAATLAGLAVNNNILIVAGLLVGASGLILTQIMCKAMNRSLMNILLSGFAKPAARAAKIEGEVRSMTAQDAYYVLEAAKSVVVIPGYGMAVAQAQHAVKELQALLEDNDATVAYAIHPVAGRMPGHMNVLLAEADIPYEQLYEMDAINPRMDSFDVAIIIGANDVVNPAAKDVQDSPIYGMPIIEAHRARNVFVMKRSASAGFAGVDNPLFFKENTRLIYGDAKDTLNNIIREFGD